MRHSPLAFEMVRQRGYRVFTPQEQNGLATGLKPMAGNTFAPQDPQEQNGQDSQDSQPRCSPLAGVNKNTTLPTSFTLREGDRRNICGHQRQPDALAFGRWLEEAISQINAGALILDVRDELPGQVVNELRQQGIVTVVLDDPSERRLYADLAFYPPVPQVQRLDWSGFCGQVYIGWEWVVLRPEIAHYLPRPHSPSHRPHPLVLVTMGGSDPCGLTLLAARGLDLLTEEFETVLALGPAFKQREALETLLSRARRKMAVQWPGDKLFDLMEQADLAIVSFGVTAYELAALGVPAIYLCLTKDHAESAKALVEAGFGQSLGLFSQVSENALAEAVREFLTAKAAGKTTTTAARRLIDGRGAERVARLVAERLC